MLVFGWPAAGLAWAPSMARTIASPMEQGSATFGLQGVLAAVQTVVYRIYTAYSCLELISVVQTSSKLNTQSAVGVQGESELGLLQHRLTMGTVVVCNQSFYDPELLDRCVLDRGNAVFRAVTMPHGPDVIVTKTGTSMVIVDASHSIRNNISMESILDRYALSFMHPWPSRVLE